MDNAQVLLVIAGMTVITAVTRAFFFISKRPWHIPEWVERGLRYAPLAALVATVAPAIFLSSQGDFIQTWKDARIYALIFAFVIYYWQRSLLLPMVAGMAVYMPLHIFLGW